MIYCVCGVSGCGKSSIAKELSKILAIPFIDADDFHSETSKLKMKSGVALEDTDRWPWLAAVKDEVKRLDPCILACSALKKSYRLFLAEGLQITFVYLRVSREVIEHRVSLRRDHYFPSSLVESQFSTFEPPKVGESTYKIIEVENHVEPVNACSNSIVRLLMCSE